MSAPLGRAGAEEARAALAAGRFADALAAADAESDPLRREVTRAEVFDLARDQRSVAQAVEAGLRHDPDHLVLLWRGAKAELWLRDGARARDYVERLERALDGAGLPQAEEASWRAVVEDFGRRAAELEELERARSSALVRARATVATVAAVCLALVGLQLARGARGRPARSPGTRPGGRS